jgi:hypothetical protein
MNHPVYIFIFQKSINVSIQGDSEISLEKKPVIGDDEKS